MASVCRVHGIVVAGESCGCRRAYEATRNQQPHRKAHRTSKHARLRARVFRRDGYRCLDCGTGEDLTLDYLVPLQDGGAMDEANAETRCRSCNSRHGRRSLTPVHPAGVTARVPRASMLSEQGAFFDVQAGSQ